MGFYGSYMLLRCPFLCALDHLSPHLPSYTHPITSYSHATLFHLPFLPFPSSFPTPSLSTPPNLPSHSSTSLSLSHPPTLPSHTPPQSRGAWRWGWPSDPVGGAPSLKTHPSDPQTQTWQPLPRDLDREKKKKLSCFRKIPCPYRIHGFHRPA